MIASSIATVAADGKSFAALVTTKEGSMAKISIGKKVPNFSLKNQDDKHVTLADFKGSTVILFFYPKDNTPGCTQEACDFRDNYQRLKRKGVVVLGISPDSSKSHRKFIEKQELNFELLSDDENEVSQLFEVWKEKSLYGKKFMGVERSTFIIGKDQKLLKEYRKVKVPGHVDEILTSIAELG